MAGIDDLRSAVADLQTAEDAENAALSTIAASLADAESQITALQGQVASGTGVSDSDLEGLAQTVASVAQSAKDAVAAATAPAAPAPTDPGTGGTGGVDPGTGAPIDTSPGTGTPVDTGTPDAPPVDPGTPADPTDGGTPAPTDPTTPDPAAPADPGTPAPDPAAPDSGTAAPSSDQRSLYVFDGDPSTVDQSVWPLAPVETTDDPPKALYFYAGDTAAGQANGDGLNGQWHLFNGLTQAAA